MLIPPDSGGVKEPFCRLKVHNQTKIYEKSDEPKEFPEGRGGFNGWDGLHHNLLNLMDDSS